MSRLCVAVPRPGVGSRRSGEDLLGPEEPAGQETSGPAHQQQSQAAGPLLLYPFTHDRRHHTRAGEEKGRVLVCKTRVLVLNASLRT